MGVCESKPSKHRNEKNNKLTTSYITNKNPLCNIKILGETFKGFFIKFNLDKKIFKCLIINSNFIPTEINEQTMTVFFHNEEIGKKEIQLNSNERIIHNFNEIGITIIEILPTDIISDDCFLIPDINYMREINKNELNNQKILMAHYSMNNFNILRGKIVKINKFEFNYYIKLDENDNNEYSSGSPIFLSNSQKVIGMHKGVSQKGYNGILFWPIFEYLNSLDQSSNKNNNDNNKVNIYADKNLLAQSTESNISFSYINAFLQCLCNIKEFVNCFKNYKIKEAIPKESQNEKLSTSFKLLIDKLYQDNTKEIKRVYIPIDLIEKISNINPLFEDISTNNEKDLINFIIMTLHEELNETQINPNYALESNYENIFEIQKDKIQMYTKFVNSFNKSHNSFIQSLFFAVNYNMCQCHNCQALTYNFQIYYYLFFPLEEVRKFKSNYNNIINELNLSDCFDYARSENIMKDDNAVYCNYCKQISPNSMRTMLFSSPEILIIILNRENDIKINFDFILNLSNYIEKKDNNMFCQYDLIGIVGKDNTNEANDEFIAYYKGYYDNNWYKYDKTIVEPIKHFRSQVIGTFIPYLFLYKKMK